MVEGARLEIVCALIAYRGFKSLSLRQKTRLEKVVFFFVYYWKKPVFDVYCCTLIKNRLFFIFHKNRLLYFLVRSLQDEKYFTTLFNDINTCNHNERVCCKWIVRYNLNDEYQCSDKRKVPVRECFDFLIRT